MSILFESKANQDTFDYVLSEINLNVSDAIYPSDAKKDNLATSFIFKDSIHVSKDYLYYCDNDRTLNLPKKASPNQSPQLIMTKFRAAAFMTRTITVAELRELCVDKTPLSMSSQTVSITLVKSKCTDYFFDFNYSYSWIYSWSFCGYGLHLCHISLSPELSIYELT